MTTFSCPHCGKGLRVTEERSGQKVRCPHCQQVMSVPASLPSVVVSSVVSPGQVSQRAADLSDPASSLTTETPPPPSHESDPACSVTQAEPRGGARNELTAFLAPPQGSGELGWLGTYRVLRVLGQGGMGAVFLAEDTALGRQVALKVMLPEMAASSSARDRFKREARATAAVENDHVIAIYHVSEERGVPFLVMPVLHGEALDQCLRRVGKLPVPEVLRIGREIADGLTAAHSQGLIHRDIKPSNIWLEARGQHGTLPGESDVSDCPARVKILDFGLARPVRADVDLTQQGALVGTPAYMAPEQVAGKPIDHRCDLFSLGCVLYRMTTGETPFPGADTISVLMAVATATPRPAHEVDAAIPRALSAVIASLLAKNPQDRPASARSVSEALAAIERDHTTTLPTLPALPPAAAPSALLTRPRRRSLLVSGALAALLGLAVAVALLVRAQTSKGTREGVSEAQGDKPEPVAEVKQEKAPDKGGQQPGAIDRPPAAAADALRREDIPVEMLSAAGGGDARNAPAELAAILGDARLMHWGAVRSVAFSPDGKLLASASQDWTVRLWDPATGLERATLAGARGAVFSVAFRHDGRLLASGGFDGRIRLWAPDGQRLPSFAAHDDLIEALAFAPKGLRLASAGKDGHIKLWDSRSRQLLHKLTAAGAVHCLAWSPDGRRLASGDATGVIQLWDPEAGKEVGRLSSPHGQVQGLAFRGDGGLLASVGDDGSLQLWDPAKDKPLRGWSVSKRPLRAVAFQPGGSLVAVPTVGQGVLLWDTETGKERGVMPAGGALCLAFRPDGKALVSGGFRCVLELWSVPEGKPLIEKLSQRGNLTCLSFSSDGRVLAAGGYQPRTTLWDMHSGKPLPVSVPVHGVTALGFARQGMLLALAGGRAPLQLWDGAAGKLVHNLELPADSHVQALAFHPEGDLVAAALSDQTVRTWATASGKLTRSWPVQRETTVLAFRGDGARVAVGTRGGVIKLYDLQGNPIEHLRGLKKPVIGLAFAARSPLLASSTGAEVQLWDTQANKELHVLTGHGATVTAVALRGDGRRLASVGLGGLLKIWDTARGETLRVIRMCPPGGRVAHMEYSPDGRYLATANSNGTVYLLRLDESSDSAQANSPLPGAAP